MSKVFQRIDRYPVQRLKWAIQRLYDAKLRRLGTISSKFNSDGREEEIFLAVGTITRQFPLLKCHECAIAIKNWLTRRNIPSKVWKISTRNADEDFMLSDRLERQGITDSITDNGIHYGVEVCGKVFDNLSPEGMLLEEWVRDFHSMSDEFDLTCLEDR
jgi:Papain fold toxin 2